MTDKSLPPDPIGRSAVAIAHRIATMTTGERAELRRGTEGAAFWRVWHGAGLDDAPGGADRWMGFIQAVAHLTGTGAASSVHAADAKIGRILHGAEIKPAAIERLLSADYATRVDILARLLRRLAKTTARVNVAELAAFFILNEPAGAKRALARHYFAAEHGSRKD